MNDLVSVVLAGHTVPKCGLLGLGGALETRSMTRPDLCIATKGNGSLNIPDAFPRKSLINTVMAAALNRRCAYKDRSSST